jgi:Raf kinase inhibitor-like YbhB/YbcL family protein
MALRIWSPAFFYNTPIPRRYTADGKDVAPPLYWSNIPRQTRSLVLLVHDHSDFDHWVVYDIPAGVLATSQGYVHPAAREGLNAWGTVGWRGPAPPPGRLHTYVFELAALDVMLGDLRHPKRVDVVRAMTGHVLEAVRIVGTYEREAARAETRGT